ncbi:MAG: efflux RND transporter permease subunit [Candidatus Eisenbacteria bacterium]
MPRGQAPIATSVLFLAAMLLGAISLARLEITLLPEIAATELNVWVPYPDAGVEQVEESVARPVEEAIVAGARRARHLDPRAPRRGGDPSAPQSRRRSRSRRAWRARTIGRHALGVAERRGSAAP